MKTFKEKKADLKILSRSLKPLVENGSFKKLNDALVNHYQENNQELSFNTYKQWEKLGYKPIKGMDYFLVWGRPITINHPSKKQNEDTDEMDFFPVAFLWSSEQVRAIEKKVLA